MSGAKQCIDRVHAAIQVMRQRFGRIDAPLQNQSVLQPVFTCTMDAHLKIAEAGGSAVREPGAVIGKGLTELLGHQSQLVAEIAGRMALSGMPVYFECEQADRRLLVEIEPVRGERGAVEGVVAAAFDPSSFDRRDHSGHGFV